MPRPDGQTLVGELVETFCHRNIAVASADRDSRLWRLDLEGMEVSVAISMDGMIVTFFSRLTGPLTLSAEMERAFLRKLLQVNLSLVGPTFALSSAAELYLSSSRSVEDLDYNEFAYTIVAFRATFRKYRTLVEKVLDLSPVMTPAAARQEVERHMSADAAREKEIGVALTMASSDSGNDSGPDEAPATAAGQIGNLDPNAEETKEIPAQTGPSRCEPVSMPSGEDASSKPEQAETAPEESSWDFGFEQNPAAPAASAARSACEESPPPGVSSGEGSSQTSQARAEDGASSAPAVEKAKPSPAPKPSGSDEWDFGG